MVSLHIIKIFVLKLTFFLQKGKLNGKKCVNNTFKFNLTDFQVKSGFLLDDDKRIVAKQIRDRVQQVQKGRERKLADKANDVSCGSILAIF